MDIHKNYDQAEEYYKKSLEIEPDNANTNGNYAQFLLIKGEKSQAQVYLDKAFNFANAFLLGHNFCEYPLKRLHNCH
jgi:Tfp pilus assembly protein PilF